MVALFVTPIVPQFSTTFLNKERISFLFYLFQPLGSYSVSKTTLLGLTKAISGEVVCDNIRVNCVAPGVVATKFASAVSTK